VAGQLGPLPLARQRTGAGRCPHRRPPHLPPARPPAVTRPGGPRLHQWRGRPPRAGHCAAAHRSPSRASQQDCLPAAALV